MGLRCGARGQAWPRGFAGIDQPRQADPKVVVHGASIEQFGIERQAAMPTRHGSEEVDAAGVMKEPYLPPPQ
jgi:hypothetical protein